jgi:hypothetical protein
MFTTMRAEVSAELDEIRSAGLYKNERMSLTSAPITTWAWPITRR